MSSSISIGIIGSDWTAEKLKKAIRMFPNFSPTYRISNHIYDARKFTEELIDQVDVLLYSGYFPYKICKELIPYHMPAHYIPLKGSSLYRAMYRLKYSLSSLSSFSIDLLTPNEVQSVLNELGEVIQPYFYNGNLSLGRIDDIVRFHQNLYLEKKTNGALTGIKLVSERLTDLQIPNEWILPTEQDIVVTLERALLSTEKRRERESQIVFGIIIVDQYEKMMRQMVSEQQIQRLKLTLHKMLLDYIEQLEGHLTSLNGQEYMFVTTRGVFERVTQGYKYMPIHDEVRRQLMITLSIGIGFGFSANQAGSHARIALNQSIEFGGDKCFIVREDRNVIGPVEMEPSVNYPLVVTDPKLLEYAEKSGMTAAYIRKLFALLDQKDQKTFTAQEIASIFGVTTRSAHRILLQWLDAELIEIVGVEKISTKGRPRQVYSLLKP
ncbi:hypothetical protein J6TS2_15270 [Heyndrickxia sporothermodurans]|nr:hypothetical protein J6TS2_15270 [Heyndrickxia sporothermodurans]